MNLCWQFQIFFVRTFKKKGLKDFFFLTWNKQTSASYQCPHIFRISFLPLLSFSPTSPLLQIHYFISLQKRANLLGIATKHGISIYPHVKAGQGNLVGGKGSPRAEESEIPPFPLLGVSQKHHANNYTKYAEDLSTGPYNLCDCCFSFWALIKPT